MAKVKCICKNCGDEFEVYPSDIKQGKGKYCSRKCQYTFQSQKMERVCLVCGKKFLVKPNIVKKGHGKLCSQECMGIYLRKRDIVKCDYCGKEIEVLSSKLKRYKNHYCNVECQNAFTKHIIIENDHALVPLTRGKFAIIDLDDVDRVSKYNWMALKHYNTYYAICSYKRKSKMRGTTLHRFLLDLEDGDGILVDHRDFNGLNCRKSNLRMCTPSQNSMNRRPLKDCSSSYKGVGWVKKDRKWQALITVNGKTFRLGRFDDEIEAAKAYDQRAIELHGEFAYLNFPNIE